MDLEIMEDGPIYGKVTTGKLPQKPTEPLLDKLFGKVIPYRKNG